MIKKIYISLLIIVGLGISSTFAVDGQIVQNGNTVTSTYDSNYKMVVNNRGLFLTQYVGLGKNMLAFSNGNYFFWLDGEKPYIGSMGDHATDLQWHFEGVPDDFLLCDYLTGSSPQNCGSKNFEENKSVAFRVLKDSDKRYYGKFTMSWQSYPQMKGSLFCFSSTEYDASVCFYACGRSDCSSVAETIGGVQPHMNLSNSQNFGINFDNIPSNRLGSYPGWAEGGEMQGSTDGTINTNVGGDYTYGTCTYKDIIDYAEYYGYNEYLCYAGSNDRDYYDPTQSYQFIPGTGVDLGTLYNYTKDGKSLFDWFKYRRGMYNGSTGNVDNALWQQQPVVLRLRFYAFITYGGDTLGGIEAVHEYCLMKNMVTGDALNDKYIGTKFKSTCNSIIEQKVNGTYLNDPSYSGTLTGSNGGSNVPISVNRGGVGNLSGGSVSDPLSFIQNFFNQLKSSMNTNGFGSPTEGFIPGYIIIVLLGLIIFRFLSH